MSIKELSDVSLAREVPEKVAEKYKAINSSSQQTVLAVDARRVEHGQGPCACCGPYSE